MFAVKEATDYNLMSLEFDLIFFIFMFEISTVINGKMIQQSNVMRKFIKYYIYMGRSFNKINC